MYHRIASEGPPGLAPYRIDPAAFERQLAYLQRYGYSTTNVDDIWRYNCDPSSRMHGKWIGLTFDDGYQDFADVAWPLLQRYGFTATVFLPTDHVGGRVEWDRDYGEPGHLMGWETIRRLAKEGVSFGSHSCSHRRLTSLTPTDLAKEVQLSRRIMKEELGFEPRGFCFPYTDYNATVMAAVSEAGYDYALAGAVPDGVRRNRFALPRIEIRNDDDIDCFAAKLPPPLPSGEERRDEYRRLRAIRHRELYPTITGSTISDAQEIGPASITSDDAQTGSHAATRGDVLRLYRELLAREPESDLALERRVGRPVVDVAMDIALSKEFFARVGALSDSRGATREEVIGLFGLLLERKPESEMVIGERVGSPILDLVTEIAKSSEFSELRASRTQTAADIAKLHEFLRPDAPIEPETAEKIARIAEFHHVRLPAIARHMMAMNRAKMAAQRGDSFAVSGWTEPSLGKFEQCQSFGGAIELVIPTVNSERWLKPFLEFYKSNDIRVVYAVDRRTTDETRDLIRRNGFPFIEVEGDEPRVESILPSIAAQTAAPWILRIDDDELPTPKLMEFAANIAAGDSIAAYTFPRANYRLNTSSGRLERSHFFAFGIDGGLERTCRLFRPDCVTYHDELHSAGFLPRTEIRAPDDVYILHFDWIVRSEEARKKKFESYARQSPSAARNWKHCALYEVVPEAWHLFGEVEDPMLRDFARSLRNIRCKS
jgi:peptidoglycan/xylan/chitin deacetylase (PgdA/CDA1 family)